MGWMPHTVPEDGRFGDGSDGETMATIQRGTGPFAGAQLG